MEFRVLGPLEVRSDERALDLGPPGVSDRAAVITDIHANLPALQARWRASTSWASRRSGRLRPASQHQRNAGPYRLTAGGRARVVPGFEGVAVHDGWAPYRNYDGCDHGLCNIHHLRELEAAAEAGHGWPVAMSCLLIGHQGSR
jgi:Transposase IS66 family